MSGRRRVVATALAGGLMLAGAAAADMPYTPVSPETVLLERPAGVARALRAARGRAEAAPADPVQAAAAARQMIQRGRVTGDPRYFGQAQALLTPWSATPEPPVDILLLRATLRQQRHDFTAALADLDRLLATHPDNTQARLTRAMVWLVLGQPQTARRDCAGLFGRASQLVTATCLGAIGAASGAAAPALAAIELALAHEPDADAETRRWARTQAAEIAERLGDSPRARRHYAAALADALATGENDVYLQAAYADFLLDQREAGTVETLLRGATAFDPLLLRLALAERQLAAAGDAAMGEACRQHAADLAARFALAEQRGDAAHTREMARAALSLQHDPATALALARRNWGIQREPADARLLLEAAAAAGQPAAAAPVRQWVQQTGLQDQRLSRGLAASEAADRGRQ